MFLAKVLIGIGVWILIGIVANLISGYFAIWKLGDKCLPYPGLFSNLYHKHFEASETKGGYGIYRKRSVAEKFLDTQIFWPLSVAQTIRKGQKAKAEFEEIIRDHSETSSVSARDQNNP